MVPSCVLPLSMLTVVCSLWDVETLCCFYEFCLAAICSMLLCLYATSCLSYVAIGFIVIVFNNLPRDCGWKLAGWLKPALLLKRWLMCTVPVKIKLTQTQTMLHLRDGARCPPDVTLGIQTKECYLGFIGESFRCLLTNFKQAVMCLLLRSGFRLATLP